MKKVTAVVGHRGGGQLLGVFDDEKKIKELKDKVKEFNEEGYVSFFKVTLNVPQKKLFGLYFK